MLYDEENIEVERITAEVKVKRLVNTITDEVLYIVNDIPFAVTKHGITCELDHTLDKVLGFSEKFGEVRNDYGNRVKVVSEEMMDKLAHEFFNTDTQDAINE